MSNILYPYNIISVISQQAIFSQWIPPLCIFAFIHTLIVPSDNMHLLLGIAGNATLMLFKQQSIMTSRMALFLPIRIFHLTDFLPIVLALTGQATQPPNLIGRIALNNQRQTKDKCNEPDQRAEADEHAAPLCFASAIDLHVPVHNFLLFLYLFH